jgi:hypothetical protein
MDVQLHSTCRVLFDLIFLVERWSAGGSAQAPCCCSRVSREPQIARGLALPAHRRGGGESNSYLHWAYLIFLSWYPYLSRVRQHNTILQYAKWFYKYLLPSKNRGDRNCYGCDRIYTIAHGFFLSHNGMETKKWRIFRGVPQSKEVTRGPPELVQHFRF